MKLTEKIGLCAECRKKPRSKYWGGRWCSYECQKAAMAKQPEERRPESGYRLEYGSADDGEGGLT